MTTITGMTGDTDPNNPVNAMQADTFPIGAALTVAYGSNERPFCTLGNMYRILGFLTGDVPGADRINSAIDACRDHVLTQLPDTLRAIDPPPPADDGAFSDEAYVGGVANKYGSTIALTPMPEQLLDR